MMHFIEKMTPALNFVNNMVRVHGLNGCGLDDCVEWEGCGLDGDLNGKCGFDDSLNGRCMGVARWGCGWECVGVSWMCRYMCVA